MGDFTILLDNLAQTCQELEQIKAQQAKDHERVSKSFEKTLLSILKQEQSILNQVEEDHQRLKDELSSIQRDNELALHNGACEINSMVHTICNVSSQLKQALVTSRNNDLTTPLGEIGCEEQTLGLSIPCLSSESNWNNITNKPVLVSDETPPWEDKSDDPGRYVGVKMEYDSDHESMSTTTYQSSVDLRKRHEDQRLNPSLRDLAVMEADNAALCPQVATKIWITGNKNTAQKLNNKLHGSKAMVANGDLSKKPSTPHLTSKGTRVNPRREAFQQLKSSSKRNQATGLKNETMTRLESEILGNLQETNDQNETETMCEEEEQDGVTNQEQNTLFRATAAYVFEDEFESSEDIVEDMETDHVRDPKTCRQVAIRDSRVPSAKKQNDGEQVPRLNSLDYSTQDTESRETSLESNAIQVTHQRPPSGIDYMRMSDETSDSLTGDILNVPQRSCSPSDSVKSSYTFIIESPKKKHPEVKCGTYSHSSNPNSRESRKRPPVITLEKSKIKSKQQTPAVPDGKQRPGTKIRNQRLQGNWRPILRSSSLPYIERLSRPHTAPSRSTRPMSAKERRDSVSSSSSTWSNPRSVATSTPSGALREIRVRVKSAQYSRKPPKTSPQHPRSLSRSEPSLVDNALAARGDGITRLLRQFGKFGSGRAELNLPHGICGSSSGSIYIVDYGNRRLQVMDIKGKLLQQFALEAKNYFDVAVSNRGLVAVTNSSDRSVDVYSKHGRLLQVISRNWGAPRGITANYRDEFIVADMKLGNICALSLDPISGRQKEITVVPGFNKPYLLASNSQGLMAVSERGLDGGCCVKVLGEDWQLLKVLGLKSSPGPVLCNPWGVCVDSQGGVLVSDWAQTHRLIYYPGRKPARVIVSGGLSSPRGLAVWQDGLVLVADSMHNCMKLFQYQDPED
ncbi:uncharacterized protein LOC143817498 isoform X2 [Ranitomeya variabilis]|uniref:uncharacterized protein LOC143817498 isoform X2 n=1 Tax=Ranitomeya variabilis TaxID=490064 RepID=UPI0040568069